MKLTYRLVIKDHVKTNISEVYGKTLGDLIEYAYHENLLTIKDKIKLGEPNKWETSPEFDNKVVKTLNLENIILVEEIPLISEPLLTFPPRKPR